MNCADFHKLLPTMIETGEPIDEKGGHLATCTNCSDLVRDLRYIAEQAKLLLPMHDPSPRVWNNIQASLQKEGLGHSSARLAAVSPKKKEWPTLGWAVALAASLLVGIALLQYSKQDSGTKELAEANTPRSLSHPGAQTQVAAGADSDDDNQLLSEVEQRSPSLRPIYEHNLRNVNSYISEAKSSVQQDPNDSEAREHLRQAYAQKATLYEMATARSLQ